MARSDGPVYEFACHESNYSMPMILSGARKAERQRLGHELPARSGTWKQDTREGKSS
jgi:hypothetical protein